MKRDGRLDETGSRWPEVMACFDRWLQSDEVERETMVAALRARDPELHALVQKAIDADRAAEVGGFLRDGVLADTERDAGAAASTRGLEGERVGPWHIERLLGVGGMGQVWLARRDDGRHRGLAALKMLRFAKLDRFAQRRFEREGRLLARLHHERIARLLDIGETPSGERYLVLEYVDGERIDHWCDCHSLGIEARLRLFVQVCDAIAYAHANLVVHRDLKPSNVLVQENGIVKVLDFGVAKLVDADESGDEATELTRAGGVAFTPEYAAPEQFDGDVITTAADVYSLGAVLYLLLAGTRPYGEDCATPARLARAMGAGEPRRLSLVLAETTGDAGQVALRRATTPERLRRTLRGDLDTILSRALKKRPQERYPSVQAFADDVRCHLDHRPIAARRDSAMYRLQKYVRRHRAGVALGALALFTAIAGVVLIVLFASEARRQAERAERSKGFLASLIQDTNPFGANRTQASTVRVLDNALQRIETDFADAPDVQFELRHDVFNVLINLGDYVKAREVARSNIAAMRHARDGSPELGAALTGFGIASAHLGDDGAARSAFAESEPLLRGAGGIWRGERIALLTGMARLDNQQGDHVAAHALHEAIVRERSMLEGKQESPDIAMDLMNLAADALNMERYREALELAQQAHDMLLKLLGPKHARAIYVDTMLGTAQSEAGQVAAGIATLQPTVELARATLGPDAIMFGVALGNLGTAQWRSGDTMAAVASLRESRRIHVLVKHPLLGRRALALGLAELAANLPEAKQTLAESVDLLGASSAGADGFLQWAHAAHASALEHAGDVAAAESEAKSARADLLAGKGAASVRLGDIDVLLAGILAAHGAAAEAATLREEARVVYVRVLGADHPKARALSQTIAP
jgi:serine/threonine-protein kinase